MGKVANRDKPAPLYLERRIGANAYVLRGDLTEAYAAGIPSVVYRFGEHIRTLRMPENSWWKGIEVFGQLATNEGTFREFLREALEVADCYMPGSFSAPFHKLFKSPRLPRTVNALFEPFFCGGWQEAKFIGRRPGTFYMYDMNSAYLWASTLGLPDCSTLEFWRDVRTDLDGCYVVEQREPRDDLPYPFSTDRTVMATLDEIECYNLDVVRVRGGYTWRNVTDPDAVTNIVKQFSFGKQMSRGYWGRWASILAVECESGTSKWKLRNHIQNYIWAHCIVSRVKMRVFEQAQEALHVFVDSVILPHKIETSDGLGGWRLAREYVDGVCIHGTGRYGPMHGPLDKHAGTKA